MKPRLLDIGCGAGGAGEGYAPYFDVTGIDIVLQPRYPHRFIQADMLTFSLEGYDAYHTSPPCQAFTNMLNWDKRYKAAHPDYIDIMRQRLRATGKPYVIENVVGAPLEKCIMLCGAMFGLRVYRHRWFESNILMFQPYHPRHIAKAVHAGMIPRNGEFYCPVGHLADKEGSQRAMGISWMQEKPEIANAIPPAYTRWIAQFLLAAIEAEEVAVS